MLSSESMKIKIVFTHVTFWTHSHKETGNSPFKNMIQELISLTNFRVA